MILQQVFEQPFATCVEAVFKIMFCDSHKLGFEHGLYMQPGFWVTDFETTSSLILILSLTLIHLHSLSPPFTLIQSLTFTLTLSLVCVVFTLSNIPSSIKIR